MTAALGRRAAAEAVGTGLLTAVVVGSGVQAAALSHDAFTDTFAGIAPACVVPFIAAQLLGAALGLGAVAIGYGRPARTADVVVPHAEPELASSGAPFRLQGPLP
ncbi:hypothetical protein [Streptomyces sp. NPDC056682]|uniref:hypothetical protein n=1 Tax=Streptomyces sp. NPDC056682 TaxID=3345909 RepID=UPI003693937A